MSLPGLAGIMPAMPKLVFTQQLRRFLTVPNVVCSATVLRQALQQAFESNPRLARYVLDDQGHLRANVVVFIDGHRVESRAKLDDVLGTDSVVHVMQALSGG